MRVIGGRFRGRPLAAPEGQGIRPTSDRVRESIFDILTSRLGSDLGQAQVLDLFAGTGAMGIEALSRGARNCVFVDCGIESRALLRENVERFGLGGVTKTLRRDSTALGEAGNLGPFDLVFVDPPYGQGLGEKSLDSALAGGWVANDALVVLEEAKGAAIAQISGLKVDNTRAYGDTQVIFLIRQ